MKTTFTILLSFMMATMFGQTVKVTLQVDMSGETVAAEGVHVAGSLNGWNTESTELTDQGGGIYAVTLDLTAGNDYEYKYLNGNAWGTEEAPPADCSVGGNNRTFTTPTEDVVLAAVPFNGCPVSNPTQMVTFSVDMSDETVGGNGVHVAGNFNGWAPGATALAPVGNEIYEVTVPVLSSLSVLQFKYINGNDWGTEETPGDGCGNGNNNRPFLLAGAGDMVQLPTAKFNGCDNPVPTKTVTFRTNLNGTTPSSDGVHIAGDFQGWDPGASQMTNTSGETYEFVATVLYTTASVQYKFVNGNAWGADEDPPDDCANGDNNRYAILPISEDPTVLPTYNFGTCDETTTSVKYINQPELLSANPTVTNSDVTIGWEESLRDEATLTIMDMTGNIVFERTIQDLSTSGNVTLNVSQWPAGMYIVQLLSKNTLSSKKIIVN